MSTEHCRQRIITLIYMIQIMGISFFFMQKEVKVWVGGGGGS